MPPLEPPPRNRPGRFPPVAVLAPVLAILLLTALAYRPCWRGRELWDDAAHLTPRALQSGAGLGRIWFQLGATQQYYPVLHTAFWLEHRVWGDSLIAYHLLNLVLHVAAACLFAVVLSRLRTAGTAPRRPAGRDWAAALLFALHPVCVESVAWIAEQKNTLSLVLYLLAALAYLRFDRVRRGGWYALASGLFLLALLTKSVTATLPAALLLVLGWRRGRLRWRHDVAPLAPWLAAGLAAGLFTAWVERAFIGAHGAAYDLGFPERLLLAGRVIWFYLGKLAWPSGLAFFYPHWTVAATLGWSTGLAGVAALFVILWRIRGRSAGPLVALLYFVGSLFPALGFFNVYPFAFSYVADHWQYLPSLGIFALAAEGGAAGARLLVARVGRRLRPLAPGGMGMVATALILTLFLLTRRQSALYRDAPTLYADTLAKDPQCWIAHNNLGAILADEGDLAAALSHLQAAVRINPGYADAHNNLGGVLVRLPGREQEGCDEFVRALRLQPGMWQAEANLGKALARVPGRRAEGIADLRAALAGHEGDPDSAALRGDLGAAYAQDPARLTEAMAAYREALRLNPGLAAIRNNLGVALARAGHPSEAEEQFQRAVRDAPAFADAHDNLGNILVQGGRGPEAIVQYRAAIALDPGFVAAHYNLGTALRAAGAEAEAEAEYRKALQLAGDSPAIRNSLGSLLLRGGKPAEAVREYAQAVRLQPQSAVFRNNLGLALTAAGRLTEAIAELQRAVQLAPDYAAAHYGLALALRQDGQSGAAAAEFAAAARLRR